LFEVIQRHFLCKSCNFFQFHLFVELAVELGILLNCDFEVIVDDFLLEFVSLE
jgi:hypothetical protein